MLKNAYFLAKIGADTAENERTLQKLARRTGPGAAGPVAAGPRQQVAWASSATQEEAGGSSHAVAQSEFWAALE